eukprot:Selendium_serpulae@DN2371_c0_g1_i1.p1
MAEIVIGMLGMGVVGGGTVELLSKVPNLRFKRIAVRDLEKQRSVAVPCGCKLTTDINEVLDDNEINLVIEVMGGTDEAWVATQKAIQREKHVVTANKALISKHMAELNTLLACRPQQMFMYEAAVCGGVPIISIISRSLILDSITSIKGIMNGTGNFMLTKMQKENADYDSVLKEAQANGFAEADPSADVLGWDARSKLCILSRISFGCIVDENTVFTQGIDFVTCADFKLASQVDCTIKQVSIAWKEGEAVMVSCSPSIIPSRSALGSVDGVLNCVEVCSANLGKTFVTGPGAGKLPSANAVVSDVMSIQRSFQDATTAIPPFCKRLDDTKVKKGLRSNFCIRTKTNDPKLSGDGFVALCQRFGLQQLRSATHLAISADEHAVMYFVAECEHERVREMIQEMPRHTDTVFFPYFI